MKQKYNLALIFITICGLLVSLYLAYQYSLPQPMTCLGDDVNSCEIVRNSPYSTIFGVKLPLLGTLYFMALLVLQILRLEHLLDAKLLDRLLGIAVIFGLIFESVMTMIQFFVIRSLCIWCTSVEVIVLVLGVVYYLYFKTPEGMETTLD